MLNRDILGNIFFFLKSADLRRVSLVSKEWNSIISENKNLTAARNDCLNPLQKTTIEAFLQYPLDDILESLKNTPKLLINVYNAIFNIPKYLSITDPKIEDVWESIEQIRSILKHDHPQNRSGSYPYVGQEDGYSMYKLVKNKSMIEDRGGNIILKNGRVILKENIITNQRDYLIAKEPTGLLSLTNCETDDVSPVKKIDVHNYISDYIYQKLLMPIIESSYHPERKMFSLSMAFCDSALSEIEIPFIYQYFKKNKQIEVVSLCYNRINPNVAMSVAHYLVCEFSIKKLYMRTNRLGNSSTACEFIKKISLHPTLIDLDLSINGIGDTVSREISNMLKINKVIQKINLYTNYIGFVGCSYIAYGLSFNKSLRSLNLGCNDIGVIGAECLLAAIKDASSSNLKTLKLYACKLNEGDHTKFNQYLTEINLSSLDLSTNCFSESQIVDIAKSLQNNTSLLKLQLNRNNVGDIGAEEIARMLTVNHALKKLELRACAINDNGGKAIIESLLINKSVTKLDIACNNFSNTGLMEMAEAICLNFTLQKLDIEPCFDRDKPRDVRKNEKAILEFINQIIKLDSIILRIEFIKTVMLTSSDADPLLIRCYAKCLSNLELQNVMNNVFTTSFEDTNLSLF